MRNYQRYDDNVMTEYVDPMMATAVVTTASIYGFLIGSAAFILYQGNKEKKELKKKLSVIEKYYEATDENFVPFSEFEKKTYAATKSFNGEIVIGKEIKNKKRFKLSSKKKDKVKDTALALNTIEEYSYKGKPVFQYGITKQETGKTTVTAFGNESTEYENKNLFNLLDNSFKKYFYYYLAKASSTHGFVEEAVGWIESEYKKIKALDSEVVKECLEEVLAEGEDYMESEEMIEETRNRILDAVEDGRITYEEAESMIADLESVTLESGGARNRYIAMQDAKVKDEIKKLEIESKRLQRLYNMATGERKRSYDEKIKNINKEISKMNKSLDGYYDEYTYKGRYDACKVDATNEGKRLHHRGTMSMDSNAHARKRFNRDFGGPTNAGDPYKRPATGYKASGVAPKLPERKAVKESAQDIMQHIQSFLEEAYEN